MTREELKLNLSTDALAAVHMAKSTEETRYYLNGVFVTPWKSGDESGVMMVATDGHVLATYFDRDGEANRSAIIDGSFGAVAMKSGRSERSARRLISENEVGRVMAVPKLKNAPELAGLVLVNEIDGTFPDWVKAIGGIRVSDDQASPHNNFTWSPLVVDRVCKIAHRLLGPGVRAMDAFMPDKNGPCLFTFGRSCPLSIVAMPMRGDDARGSCAWGHISGEAIASVAQEASALAAE